MLFVHWLHDGGALLNQLAAREPYILFVTVAPAIISITGAQGKRG
ncbi:hypothetical protein X759_31040 [Mesorhizobium sp. LSHC420B00]|nr:hypothetical protein X759_31040 [Mesorhizobium sp. LSHC420B00]